MKGTKVEIWGVYPPPIGGISVYCKRLTDAVHQFVGETEQSDDLTMLAIKYNRL